MNRTRTDDECYSSKLPNEAVLRNSSVAVKSSGKTGVIMMCSQAASADMPNDVDIIASISKRASGYLRLFALTASLMVTACATPDNYQPRVTQISIPELNVETTASVGDRMLVQGTSTLTKGIVLAAPNNIVNRRFTAGFYPQTGEDEDYTYHSFQAGQPIGGLGAIRAADAFDVESLRADKNKQQLCIMLASRALAFGIKPCDTEGTYTRTERPVVGANNFQQSLIYSGRVGNRIKIGYREFSGDIARPAFSNEVEYDLSASDTVTYQGARLRILDANNERIRYVVLQNFNVAQ